MNFDKVMKGMKKQDNKNTIEEAEWQKGRQEFLKELQMLQIRFNVHGKALIYPEGPKIIWIPISNDKNKLKEIQKQAYESIETGKQDSIS